MAPKINNASKRPAANTTPKDNKNEATNNPLPMADSANSIASGVQNMSGSDEASNTEAEPLECLRCTKFLRSTERLAPHATAQCPVQGKVKQLWLDATQSNANKANAGSFDEAELFLKSYEDSAPQERKVYNKNRLEDAFRTVRRGNGRPGSQAAQSSNTGKSQTGLPRHASQRTCLKFSKMPDCSPDPQPDFSRTPMLGGHNSNELAVAERNQIRVITNYVEVQEVPQVIFEYGVKYKPIKKDQTGTVDRPGGTATSGSANDAELKIEKRSQKQQVFEALKSREPFAGRFDWATDYNTIWSVEPLSGRWIDGQLFDIDPLQFKKLSGKLCTTGVEVKSSRRIQLGNGSAAVSRALLNTLNTEAGASVPIAALNALISNHAINGTSTSGRLISAGPNKFYLKGGYKAEHGLRVHRGYYTSIRPGRQNVLLNIGTLSGAFLEPKSVDQFIAQCRDSKWHEYGKGHDRGEQILNGKTARIMYERQAPPNATYEPNEEANRTRVIAGFGAVPSQQMFDFQGVQTSVKEYFERLGSTDLKDNLKCVNVGVRPKLSEVKNAQTGKLELKEDKKTVGKQIWIPQQYLAVNPNQMFGKRLSPGHMQFMLQSALREPLKNQKLIIEEAFPALGLNDPSLGRLKLKINPHLISVPARMLPDPTILYNSSLKNPRSAKWDLRDVFFRRPGEAEAPNGTARTILTLDFRQSKKETSLADLSKHVLDRMWYHGIQNTVYAAGNVRYGYAQAGTPVLSSCTDSALFQAVQNYRTPSSDLKAPELHLVVLNDKDSDSYAAVKRVFDQLIGAHTVCIAGDARLVTPVVDEQNRAVVDKNGRRVYKLKEPGGNAQLYSNLAMKFNLKLGGQNHVPGVGKTSAFDKYGETMVVGADVSHAPSQMNHCPSVASVVASDGPDMATFPGSMRLQGSKQEIIADLQSMMVERLERYQSNNRSLPKRIIFYRDGVGEDQYQKVRDVEIKAVLAAFRHVSRGAADPSLTFVVCGKRHNTRFFPGEKTKPQNIDRKTGNIAAGLLVDQVITRPDVDQTYDFFLQSHNALAGTAKPAHYVVLEAGDMPSSAIQSFTHAMCFNYARSTLGVSYATPAYYADRLCERGTMYLKAYTEDRETPDIDMSDAEKSGGPKGMADYNTRVAADVSNSPLWNPNLNSNDAGRRQRKNPWHPNMDKVMFWL